MTAPIEQIARDLVSSVEQCLMQSDPKEAEFLVAKALRQACGRRPEPIWEVDSPNSRHPTYHEMIVLGFINGYELGHAISRDLPKPEILRHAIIYKDRVLMPGSRVMWSGPPDSLLELQATDGQQPAVADAAQKIIDYMGEYLEGNPLLVQENAVRYALSKVFPAAHIPKGYKLVPIEPTNAMLKALACQTVLDNEDMLFGLATYAAMIAVAPTPPVQHQPEWSCAKCGYLNNGVVCTKCGGQPAPWGKHLNCGTNIRVRNTRFYCPKCKQDLGDAMIAAAPHPVRGGEK